jgi:hypothetical protein
MNTLLKEFIESGEFYTLFQRKIFDYESPILCRWLGKYTCEITGLAFFNVPEPDMLLTLYSDSGGIDVLIRRGEIESFIKGDPSHDGSFLCGKGFVEFKHILDYKLAEMDLFYKLENQYVVPNTFDNTKDLYQAYLSEIEKKLANTDLSELEKFSYWSDQHSVRFLYEQLYIEVHKGDIVLTEVEFHGFHAKAYIDPAKDCTVDIE